MAMGQNQWYHFGVGAPPSLVYFSGDWDVHWGYGLLTHGHVEKITLACYLREGRSCLPFDTKNWPVFFAEQPFWGCCKGKLLKGQLEDRLFLDTQNGLDLLNRVEESSYF